VTNLVRQSVKFCGSSHTLSSFLVIRKPLRDTGGGTYCHVSYAIPETISNNTHNNLGKYVFVLTDMCILNYPNTLQIFFSRLKVDVIRDGHPITLLPPLPPARTSYADDKHPHPCCRLTPPPPPPHPGVRIERGREREATPPPAGVLVAW
jgi:hypothetical protein